MNEPTPPTELTDAELDELWDVASYKHKRSALDELTVKRLVHQARRALIIQKRAEEAEARVKELWERICAADDVLDVVHVIRDGGGALPAELLDAFNPWLDAESKRVGEAFARLRSQKR